MRSFHRVMLSVFVVFHAASVFSFSAHPVVKRKTVNLRSQINVISPKAGESFKVGSPLAIAWTYSGNVGQTVRVLLHKNSAPAADIVLVSLTLDGSGAGKCSIATPKTTLPGNDYSIVVESNLDPKMKGQSGLFSLIDAYLKLKNRSPIQIGGLVRKDFSLPLIDVNQPAGDKPWYCGTSHPITWVNKSSDKSFSVHISLLKGDVFQQTIAASIPVSQGSFNWTIPAGIPYYDQYRVSIACATDEKKYFGTSEFFTIIGAPTISSFSPAIGGSGDVIVITGSNFYGRNDSFHFILNYVKDSETDVSIGDLKGSSGGAQLKVISSTVIHAKVAGWSSSGNVTVKSPAGSASLPGFTMLYSPWDLYGGDDRVYWVDGSRQHGLIVADVGWDSGSMTCPYDCALQNIANYRGGGFSDWRLPTRDELIKLHYANPSQYGLSDSLYWTSEDAGNGENWAMYVFMQPGPGEGWQKKVPRTYSIKYHAVRSF